MRLPRRASVLFIAAFALSSSCAGKPPPLGLVHVDVASVRRTGVTLVQAARRAADGNVGVLLHVERLRDHPSSWSIARLAGWGDLLEDAGLSPIFDVRRVYISAPAVVSCRPVIVYEHALSDARVHQALDRLLEKSRGERAVVDGLGFPGISITPRANTLLVAAPRSGLLVMMPMDRAPMIGSFTRARGLPAPRSNEAWVGWSNEPGWPTLPPMLAPLVLRRGKATFTLAADYTVFLEGRSRTDETARADAALLTKVAEEQLKIPGLGLRVLDPVTFKATGRQVQGTMKLLPSDLSWLLAQMTGPCW